MPGDFLMMAHELTLVERAIHSHSNDQIAVSDEVRDALEQSSETWHDNAPGDAALEELAKVRGASYELTAMLEKRRIVDYPEEDSPTIAIGSRVVLSAASWGEEMAGLVIGYPRILYPSHYHEGDLDLLTYLSPIGSGILGHTDGDQLTIDINERPVDFTIEEVDQIAIASIASDIIENRK